MATRRFQVFEWKGVYALKPYIPRMASLRQKPVGDQLRAGTEWVYGFKSRGKNKEEVKGMVQALRERFKCEKVLAIPPSKTKSQPNALQDVFMSYIHRTQDTITRKYNHKKDLDDEYKSSYIISGIQKKDRVLIIDDICTTGKTLIHFKERLEDAGCDVVMACIGYHYKLEFKEWEVLEYDDESEAPIKTGNNEDFNLREAAAFLKDKGYKVSERTVYRNSKEGKIRPDVEKKRYSLNAVLKYAETHLIPLGTVQKKKAGELQEKKLKLEIELQEEKLAFERFKRLKEEGKSIDKDQAHLERASALSIVEAELIGAFQTHAGDLTVTVAGGDEKNAPAMARETMEIIHQTLNGLAAMKEYQVDF
jgi:hypothetical protein